MSKELTNTNCKNCKNKLLEQAKYCDACGQSIVSKRKSFATLFISFFSDILSIDKKTVNSFLGLFVPGKLTKAYFSGEHSKYVSPWRVFIVSFIVMLLVVSVIDDKSISDKGIFDLKTEKVHKKSIKDFNLDSLKAINPVFGDIQSIQEIINHYETTKRLIKDSFCLGLVDSSQVVLEQLISDVYLDSTTFNNNIFVSRYDLKYYSLEKLQKKYDIEYTRLPWYKRMEQILQYRVRSNKLDLKKILQFVYSNINWFILLMLPFLAMIFKLLYIRRDRYFIEHFIFNLHIHSAILLLVSLFSLMYSVIPSTITVTIIYIAILSYYLFAMKNYFKQSWRKTILKFIVFLFLYAFVFTCVATVFGVYGAAYG